MADMGRDLPLGHFVGCLRGDELQAGLLLLQSFLQFPLGLARPEDQDNRGIMETGNDLVIISREVPGVFPLA